MDSSSQAIFVSIASYRDLQLVPTIADCLAKARFPDRLRFGICWQHGAEELSLPYQKDDRFRILDVSFRDSRGACWARAEVLNLWQGEDWILQIDSHCRFTRHWDEKLIAMAAQTGSPKPILTTYASPFVPGENEVLQNSPQLMALQGFTEEGIPHMKPMLIPDWHRRTAPVRARFVSAGFFFAPGALVREVGYDPDLYFMGEETAITVRAFTHGYDFFHPCETIVWHDYVRKDATKHWDDHAEANSDRRTGQNWSELDRRSKAKVKRLLAGEPVESCGLGAVRTLQQYEEYAGLSFSLRKAQTYTVRCGEPPNPEAAPDWADAIHTWMVRIHFDRSLLPVGALDADSFWYVGVHDEIGAEIYRRDVQRAELDALAGDEPNIAIVCELQSANLPISWSVWPVSGNYGWLRRLSGNFADEDYAIISDDENE